MLRIKGLNLLYIISILLLISCESDSSETEGFDKNIAFICNQGSGYLTILDLETNSILEEIDLSIKIQAYVDQGNSVDELYVNSPTPHYVQASYDGKYLYVMLTRKTGAILKMNSSFEVIDFLQIDNTEFPAHLQLSRDNNTIYISTWTTNLNGSADGVSSSNNYIVKVDNKFENRVNYITPAGAHGIKLTPDESKLIIGHDLADYINIIPTNQFDSQNPLSTAKAISSNPSQNGGNSTVIHSPSQVGISPDNNYAFFACRKSSKILVYNIMQSDTLGFVDLKEIFNIDKAGPYSVEVGPKSGYGNSDKKYIYINMKDGGYFGRIKFDDSKSKFEDKFIASSSDVISLENNTARPHGLDITDNGKIAVVSSEFSNDNSNESHSFIVDLENWSLKKTFTTKIHSRGVAIYPGVGN